MCEDLFGPKIDTTYVTTKVAEIGYIFPPPWNYSAPNVVLPNGDYDPWSSLGSTITKPDQHQFAVLTHGAAHCSDMYPSRVGEPAALEATRKVIRAEVDYYITKNVVPTAIPASSTPSSGCVDAAADCAQTMSDCKNALYKPLLCKYCQVRDRKKEPNYI